MPGGATAGACYGASHGLALLAGVVPLTLHSSKFSFYVAGSSPWSEMIPLCSRHMSVYAKFSSVQVGSSVYARLGLLMVSTRRANVGHMYLLCLREHLGVVVPTLHGIGLALAHLMTRCKVGQVYAM